MATAKPKKTASAKKIVDVKPDGDGATGTSRPVIVTNRPILKDPMMAEISQLTGGLEVTESKQATSEPTSGKSKTEPKEVGGAPELAKDTSKKDDDSPPEKSEAISASVPAQKKVITPPSETDVKEAEEAVVDTGQPQQPTIAELAKTTGPQPSKDAIVKDSEQSAPSVDSADEVLATDDKSKEESSEDPQAAQEPGGAIRPGRSFDETANEADTAKAPEGLEQIGIDEKGNAKKQVKKGGELSADQQKAIEKEKYFLPITTAETRRMRREILFATLFVLVLIVVWLDIMLDAGLLSLGNIKAVTNFF
ncbi:hypothetical protein BH09PAT4_BH09PAT4_01520 [soil metagenome]